MKDNYSTHTKIRTVFKCQNGHFIAGIAILKASSGYMCPYCTEPCPITDITDTQEGQDYHAQARIDIHSPPPLRVIRT